MNVPVRQRHVFLEGSDDEEDDEEEDTNPKEHFYKTCLRIARNDPTMVEASEWPRDRYGNQQRWNDSDLFLLGNSLIGNTHLQLLHIENTSSLFSYSHGIELKHYVAALLSRKSTVL